MRGVSPVIGITCDIIDGRFAAGVGYAEHVSACGGTPILLSCLADCADDFVRLCDGFILTGGDDPIMEDWGITTHPKATPIHRQRQSFELHLLRALETQPDVPVLGVCLGMQLMGLHAGGALDQHLPDTLATAQQHWGRVPHTIAGEIGSGEVLSHHRQAISDPGSMRVIATAPDGVIEAIDAADRKFYVGVQWHPERTEHAPLGRDLIHKLVTMSGQPARAECASRAERRPPRQRSPSGRG